MVDIEKIGKINISYEMGKTEIKNDLNRNDSLSEENTGVLYENNFNKDTLCSIQEAKVKVAVNNQQLQNFLSGLGFYKGAINGDFSSDASKKAISNFQKVYGLNVDGKMTDKTRKKLQEVHNMYSRVSTGKELTALASNSNLGLDYIEKQNLAKIWTFLRVGMGFTKNQAAGICGNFYNESKFSSDNAQEQKGGKYKNDHDSGYTFSTDDKVGYGIEQWTVPDVKKTLKNTAKEMGVNVSDINAQLATVRKEIEKTRINDWKAVISKITYNEVSDAFLDNVEKPKQKNYAQRRAYSKKIYDALKNF